MMESQVKQSEADMQTLGKIQHQSFSFGKVGPSCFIATQANLKQM